MEEILSDVQAGSVALMISGKGKDCPKIQRRMAEFAAAGGGGSDAQTS